MMYSENMLIFKIKENKKLRNKKCYWTPSDKFIARQNLITKGTIVLTELGKVKITSRPSQNGLLMEF
jgi:small subunit ribosomal protein S8e